MIFHRTGVDHPSCRNFLTRSVNSFAVLKPISWFFVANTMFRSRIVMVFPAERVTSVDRSAPASTMSSKRVVQSDVNVAAHDP